MGLHPSELELVVPVLPPIWARRVVGRRRERLPRTAVDHVEQNRQDLVVGFAADDLGVTRGKLDMMLPLLSAMAVTNRGRLSFRCWQTPSRP